MPHSQVPANCLYPEPARSSPYPHIPLPEDPSLYNPPIYGWVFQVVSFPQVSLQKPSKNYYTLWSLHQELQYITFSFTLPVGLCTVRTATRQNLLPSSWVPFIPLDKGKGKSKATPVQALRVPRGWGFQISAHAVGKVSPTHRPPLPPPQGNIPGTHFCYRLSRP